MNQTHESSAPLKEKSDEGGQRKKKSGRSKKRKASRQHSESAGKHSSESGGKEQLQETADEAVVAEVVPPQGSVGYLSLRCCTEGMQSKNVRSNPQEPSRTSLRFLSQTQEDVYSPRQMFLSQEITRLSKMPTDVTDRDHEDEPAVQTKAPSEDGEKPKDDPGTVKSDKKATKHREKGDPQVDAKDRKVLKCVCAAGFIAMVIVASLAAIMLFIHLFAQALRYECYTAYCIAARNDMENLLSETVNPCDDFYGYTCAKWLKDPHRVVGFVKDTNDTFYRVSASALSSRLLQKTDPQGMHVFHRLHYVCYKFMLTRNFSWTAGAAYAMKFLNTSSVLEAKLYPEMLREVIRISLTTGIETTFKIFFEQVGKKGKLHLTTGTSIAGKVRKTFSSLLPGQDVEDRLYRDIEMYLSDILDIIYAGSNKTETVQQLLSWDHQLDALLSQPVYDKMSYPFLAFKRMMYPIPMQEVLDMVNAAVPGWLRMKLDDDIYVTGLASVQKMRAILNVSDQATKSLYYVTHLVGEVVQYSYLNFIRFTSNDVQSVSVICMKIAHSCLTHTWPYLMARLFAKDKRAENVRTMGSTIRSTIIEKQMLYWMDSYTRQNKERDLRDLAFRTYDVKLLGERLSPAVNYSSVEFHEEEFVSNFLRAKLFDAKMLKEQLPANDTFDLIRYQLTSNLSYVPPHSVFVPTSYQGEPIFYYKEDEAMPFYFNYATLGVLLAKEMIRATGPLRSWSQETRLQFNASIDCLHKVRASLGLTATQDVDDVSWEKSAFAWTYGAWIVYRAVRDKIQAHGPKTFYRVWPVARRTFFIRSCMLACTSLETGTPLLPREKCLLPALANPDFSDVFKCGGRPASKVDSCISSVYRSS